MFWRHICWFIVSIASLYCSVANGQWDESSLTPIYSDGVFLDVIPSTDNRLEFLPVVVDPTQAYGEYAFLVVSTDQKSAMLVEGVTLQDGSTLCAAYFASSSNARSGESWLGFMGQFGSDYVFFLTGGSAPADPDWLNYGSEAGFGLAAGAAGGIVGIYVGGAAATAAAVGSGSNLVGAGTGLATGGLIGGGLGTGGGYVLGGSTGATVGGTLGGAAGGQERMDRVDSTDFDSGGSCYSSTSCGTGRSSGSSRSVA
jgi:hypothetical protein